MKKILRCVLFIVMIGALFGCGLKGPLYMPTNTMSNLSLAHAG